MPTVSRLTGNGSRSEGFAVVTESAGDTYRYELRVRSHESENQKGTVELVSRELNGEPVEVEATEAVRDAIEDYGYEVA